MFWRVFVVLLSVGCLRAEHVVGRPNLKLLQCFEFKKNYWIVGHAFHTSSVQFKDECLKMCLTSSIRKAKCLSAMHVPNDDECVISDQNELTKPELFIENDTPASFTVNFYRNVCAEPPDGDEDGARRLAARLQGYRGGEGIIEMVQVDGKATQAMVVISGLRENAVYDVEFVNERRDGRCPKTRNGKGKNVLMVETDHTGMAIQPWIAVDFDSMQRDLVGKTIVVIDKSSRIVVDCGTILDSGSNSTSLKSSSLSVQTVSPVVFSLIFSGILMFIF